MSQSRELLRTFARPAGSRQLRGAASRVTSTQQRAFTRKASPLIGSSSLALRSNTEYAATQRQPQRRFVSAAAASDLPQSSKTDPQTAADDINALIEKIGENEAQMVEILEELELMGRKMR